MGSARTQAAPALDQGVVPAGSPHAAEALVMAATVGAAAAIYSLFVLERKTGVILGRAAFLRTPLSGGEAALFVIYFLAEVLILLFTSSVVLGWVAARIVPRIKRARKAAIALPALAFMVLITAHFKVLSYMRDGIDLALVRQLGGDNVGTALSYIQNELAGLAPIAVVSVLWIGAAVWLLGRYGAQLVAWLQRRQGVARLGGRRSLALMNGVLLVLPILFAPLSDAFHEALTYSLVHQVYLAPAAVLTDFDGDGYSLLTRPRDTAPFNAKLNPYALDIPGNGIDEDGIGGDLPQVILDPPERPWRAEDLAPKSAILIVVESARMDLLEEALGDPMPVLRSTPGQRVIMLSHQGFTTPSVTSAMTGDVTRGGGREPLLHRFKRLGYRTAVISGQNEGFGQMADRTGMRSADFFADATSFPSKERLYSTTNEAGLAVSCDTLNATFATWLGGLRRDERFFAYINWQAMHFPYYWKGEKLSLIRDPLPRGDIVPANRERLIGTYRNAARIVDDTFRDLLRILGELGRRRDTVILVTGDHGEELFDNGYLGHGTNLSYEQNGALGKLINSDWKIPGGHVGISDAGALLYNALLLPGLPQQLLRERVVGAVGTFRRPKQIGVFAEDGVLTKYDFSRNKWSRQVRPGAPFEAAQPDVAVIRLWESKALEQAKAPD